MKRLLTSTVIALGLLAGTAHAAHAMSEKEEMMPKLASVLTTMKMYEMVCPRDLPAVSVDIRAGFKTMKPKDRKMLDSYMPAAAAENETDIKAIGSIKWCEVIDTTTYDKMRAKKY